MAKKDAPRIFQPILQKLTKNLLIWWINQEPFYSMLWFGRWFDWLWNLTVGWLEDLSTDPEKIDQKSFYPVEFD